MMKQNKMQNERTNKRKLVNPTKKEWRWHVAQFGVGCLLLFFAGNVPVFAAGNVDTSQITGGFDAIYQVIAAIVSSTGTIFSNPGTTDHCGHPDRTAKLGGDGKCQDG